MLTKGLAQANRGACAFQTQMQQENHAETADLENEATKVLATILQHTRSGQSPRSVPWSELNGWLPALQNAEYTVTPSASFAATGHVTVQGVLTDPDVGPVCLTVPDRVVSSSQYATYVSGTGCPS